MPMPPSKRDIAKIERLLTDGYLFVFSQNSTVGTKAELINSYKNPIPNGLTVEAIDISDPKVRLYGNTAIEIAKLTFRYKTADGKTVSYDFTGSIVAIKEKEKWKIASFHASLIPPLSTESNSSK